MSQYENQAFLDFYFNGRKGASFNLIRTSQSSRYTEDLLPAVKDITVNIDGADGALYCGSTYAKRIFTVNFVFDNLLHSDLDAISQWLGDKGIHPFSLSEWSDKWYPVKVTNQVILKHIPFENENGVLIYKGEGSIQFTCYATDLQITTYYGSAYPSEIAELPWIVN